MKDKSLKCFVTYAHILGAKIAMNHLRDKGLDVQMDELPKEQDAKLYIEEDKVEYARELLKEWRREIQKKYAMMIYK